MTFVSKDDGSIKKNDGFIKKVDVFIKKKLMVVSITSKKSPKSAPRFLKKGCRKICNLRIQNFVCPAEKSFPVCDFSPKLATQVTIIVATLHDLSVPSCVVVVQFPMHGFCIFLISINATLASSMKDVMS